MSFKSSPDWGSPSWFWFGYGHWSLVQPCSKFELSILILELQRTSMSLKSWFGLCRMLEDPDLGSVSWLWFGYGHRSIVHLCSEFWLYILILKVQRTSMSFKSWFGAFEEAKGLWLDFEILILSLIWSLVFYTPIFWILALNLDFEGAKNIQVLQVLIWGFRGCCKFLNWVWHLNIDLDNVTGLWYTLVPNFGSLSQFWRCKKHPCPLSPDWRLWRMLEVPYLVLAYWFWIGYCHGSLVHRSYKLWLSILILKVQETSMSFKAWFGALKNAVSSWLGFGILILIWIWLLVFLTPKSWKFKGFSLPEICLDRFGQFR